MFYAHNGAALAASPSDKDVPVVAFLIASWAPDITGIGHWLPFGLVLAAAFFAYGRRRWSTRAGIALGLLVLSHLVLDLVVGLQIWPGGRFIGLNLSTHSSRELALELLFVVVGFAVYASKRGRSAFLALAFLLTVGFAIAVWSYPDDPTDHSPPIAKLAVGVTGLLITSALLVIGERRGSAQRQV